MPPRDGDRPDPDQLLERVTSEERRGLRGRLKIYFGAAPGVGKTFAMLSAARRLLAQGRDVVVGVVETHGRAETAMLLREIEVLPRRQVAYRGTVLQELDVDAALARRPEVLIVDELAHTNAPGSRFGKRWQDVRALLEAGIDVDTTLNVQHVDSLVDVVAQITSVQVRETVPDEFFDQADEIELVDLPPDLLLERLRAGKVYVPEAAQAALDSFFRKGNLTALRELALRKTAQWVDAQLTRYKQQHGVQRIWPAGERMLVCVGPSPLSARLVRATHRNAAATRAEWFAVFVETPFTARHLTQGDRDRVNQHLRLAESLGGRTVTLEADSGADAVLAFAREHNVGRIVLGKTGQSRWQELLRGSFTMDVIRSSGDIDVHVVRAGDEDGEPNRGRDRDAPAALAAPRFEPLRFLWGAAYALSATAVAFAVFEGPDLSAEAMLLILGVALAALRCGTGPAVLAAFVGVLAFNFFFTAPFFTFNVDDPAYIVAFGVMLLVGLAISTLVNEVRERALAARDRERETAALYSLTRELAGASSRQDVARVTVAHLRDAFPGQLAFLVPTGAEGITTASVAASHGIPDWLGPNELGVARWAWVHGQPAGEGTRYLPGTTGLFLPVSGRRGRSAVLALRRAENTPAIASKTRLLVDTFVEQAGLALDRVGAAEEQLRQQQEAAAERLRSTLLASVSHDLRTPLATITGAASSLVDDADLSPTEQRELAQGILEQARRLNELVANLVFATRLEGGAVQVRADWTSIEEVVGAALRRARELLAAHDVDVEVEPGLPLVRADAVLLEQAVHILLENAARHTPNGTRVHVRAFAADGAVVVEVADEGPGIPEAERARVFQRFERGPHSAGMGLGLAICEGIARAHGGRAWAEPGRARGAAFRILVPLPKQQPPRPVGEEVQEIAGEEGVA